VDLLVEPTATLKGKHVLVVEDILDTGRTARAILEHVQEEEPASVALCVLLDKPSRRVEGIEADFVGFTIGEYFVVGYGLDHDERYRALPAVHILEEDC
jgi:hypoxanthine phosphoribosyltransferase